MTGPAARAWLLALAACALAACGQSPPQIVSSERFVLIEHMQVVGSCAEEGAAVSPVRYAGYVDRWRDTQKSQELLQGSVTAVERFREPAGGKQRPQLRFG